MKTLNSTYILDIPSNDRALFRSLVKRFGWRAKEQVRQPITHLDAAIKAAHEDE